MDWIHIHIYIYINTYTDTYTYTHTYTYMYMYMYNGFADEIFILVGQITVLSCSARARLRFVPGRRAGAGGLQHPEQLAASEGEGGR